MVGNDLEITLLLTLGTLTNDLAAYHEVRAKLVHVLRGFTKHVDAAVDTGIRSTAITKGRLFDQIEIIFFLAHNGESNIQFTRRLPCLVLAASEDRFEVDSLNLNALFLHQADGKHAIEPTREQCDTTSWHGSITPATRGHKHAVKK